MATNLLELVARIRFDSKDYEKDIKDAESKASKFASGVKTAFKVGATAIGMVGTAATVLGKKFIDGAKDVANYGDNIDKMSQKIGVSAEAYQKWDFVLQQNGANIESLRPSMKTLATQAQSNAEEFEKLGISQSELKTLNQEELFERTIQGLQKMEEGTERTATASKLLGRGATELAPLLNQSAEATEELKNQAEKYGFVMSDKAVKASASFNDSMNLMQQTAKGLKNRLIGEFLPSLTLVTDGLGKLFAGDMTGIEDINQGITETINNIVDTVPKIIEIAEPIITTLATAIIDNLPKLLDTAVTLITDLGTYIISNLPLILETGLQIILSLADGITNSLPTLIPALVDVITQIVEKLTAPDTLTQLIMAAVTLILTLADGLVGAKTQLIKAMPTIISNVVSALIKLAPQLLKASVKLISTLAIGFVQSVGAVRKAIGTINDKIKEKFGEIKDKAKTWGKDLLQNFIDGIKDKIKALRDKVSDVADTIKSYIHFSVPDEGPLADADTYMPDMIDLFTKGIDQNKYKLVNSVQGLAGSIDNSLGYGGYYQYGNAGNDNSTQEFIFTIDDKSNAPLLQIARLLFPYIKIVEKEKGARVSYA